MRPIIVPLTQKKVRGHPILGRDPWFGNLGIKDSLCEFLLKYIQYY